jgi:hypothetical protein
MDKATIISMVLALAPILYMLIISRKSIISLFCSLRKQDAASTKNHSIPTEYEKILKAVGGLENAVQPNTGIHFSETVYLNRANYLRKETKLYNLINTLEL